MKTRPDFGLIVATLLLIATVAVFTAALLLAGGSTP